MVLLLLIRINKYYLKALIMAKMGDGGGLAWTYTFTGPKITLSTAQWGGAQGLFLPSLSNLILS